MSWRAKVEEILSKAKELEKDYGWIEAVTLYKLALPIVGKKDFLWKRDNSYHDHANVNIPT